MRGIEKDINGYRLEICSNSSYSALQAQKGGASRVELCQNLENGGTTPSYAQIKRSRELLDIGVHVLIRPRGGDFVYAEAEFEEIKMDVAFCKETGCDGVVVGILHPDGRVDKERCAELVALAKPMTCVFHRAFDRCSDPLQALEDIIALGFDRILTSGMRNTALEGAQLLKELIAQAGGRIEIMPGAGVTAVNIEHILLTTGATSIHSSAKAVVPSRMTFESEDLEGMNEPTMETSKENVEALVRRLQDM